MRWMGWRRRRGGSEKSLLRNRDMRRRRRKRSGGAFVELRKVGVGEEVHFCANARPPTKFYSAEFSKKNLRAHYFS